MARKIYTKTGDQGETGLFGGGRVAKNHPRVEAYGAVDEANAVIGLAISRETDPEIGDALVEVQSQLLALGAMLAAPAPAAGAGGHGAGGAINDSDIERLEGRIDHAEAELPELKSFVLPGGSPAAAALHLARTVVRRAERRTLALVQAGDADAIAVRYLNRLSDLLFVLARLSNRRSGEPDVVWRANANEETS